MISGLLNISIISFILFDRCSRSDTQSQLPTCIAEKISDFKASNAYSKGACVKEYTFLSETVCFFDPGDCGADTSSSALDSGCDILSD